MIALIENWFTIDDDFVQQIIGIFNHESEIPEEFKRKTYKNTELWRNTPDYERFYNLEDSKQLEYTFNPINYGYGYPQFFSLKEITIGEIIKG